LPLAASAHGLGHLMAPYGPEEAPPNIPAPAVPLSEIGVERWQYVLWFQITRAAFIPCSTGKTEIR
jgi:hypothetical protein